MRLTDSEETRLRRALSIIGAEATRSEPNPEEQQSTRQGPMLWLRQRLTLVAACSAAAVIAAIVILDIATNTEGRTDNDASVDVSGPERIACSEQIFEGSIVSVSEPDSKQNVRFKVRVSEWLKPKAGQDVVAFAAPSARALVVAPYKPGQHVFVMVQDPPRILAQVSRGREAKWERSEFDQDWREAQHTKCPAFWNNPDAGPNVPDDS